jgi:hypothetical protein
MKDHYMNKILSGLSAGMVRLCGRVTVLILTLFAISSPAQAWLFWVPPERLSGPVSFDDPAMVLPLPGATEAEGKANILWTLRAGLNVAALQCQFAPALATVANYNTLLIQHDKELKQSYGRLEGYFKRTNKSPRIAARMFDDYNTKTYNAFSSLLGQLNFCDAASNIGAAALAARIGELQPLAETRLRTLKNALTPVPSMDKKCWKKGVLRDRCQIGAKAS